MHISDVLNNRDISFIKESKKIQRILSERERFYKTSYGDFSFFEFVEHCFRSLPLSGNYIGSIEYMSNNDFADCYSIEDFCLLCEKVVSLLYQTLSLARRNATVNFNILENKTEQVMKVIKFDLQRSGFKIDFQKTDSFGEVAIVYPSDFLVMKSTEAEPELAESIINYSRPSLQGNLVEKEKHLHFIIKGVEHIAQDKTFRYPEIAEQAETIFNMFHIRHDNIKGKVKNNLLEKMSNKELEEIFDMGYQLSLELLILDNFMNIDKKVTDLRKRMKQK